MPVYSHCFLRLLYDHISQRLQLVTTSLICARSSSRNIALVSSEFSARNLGNISLCRRVQCHSSHRTSSEYLVVKPVMVAWADVQVSLLRVLSDYLYIPKQAGIFQLSSRALPCPDKVQLEKSTLSPCRNRQRVHQVSEELQE